ncbi:MAG: hypothetical protein AB7G75_18005 [Candidatus Binatia bacterium]
MLTLTSAVPGNASESHARVIPSPALRTSPPLRASRAIPRLEKRKPKLLDQVREAIRMRHYSWRTEQTYV